MGLLKSLFTNCAHPKGRMGRAMLKFMNLCHAPLTNWGLSLVDIQDGWTMLDIGCGGGATLKRLLKRSQGAKVYGIDISEESVAKAIKVNAEVIDKQVFVQQGSAAELPYTPEQLKQFLDEAGFTQTEIHRKKPSYATILGVNP